MECWDPAKIKGKCKFPQSLTLAWKLQFYQQPVLSVFPPWSDRLTSFNFWGSTCQNIQVCNCRLSFVLSSQMVFIPRRQWPLQHPTWSHRCLSLTPLYFDLWCIIYWNYAEKNSTLFISLDTKPPFINAMSVRNFLKANQVSKCIFGRIQVKLNG